MKIVPSHSSFVSRSWFGWALSCLFHLLTLIILACLVAGDGDPGSNDRRIEFRSEINSSSIDDSLSLEILSATELPSTDHTFQLNPEEVKATVQDSRVEVTNESVQLDSEWLAGDRGLSSSFERDFAALEIAQELTVESSGSIQSHLATFSRSSAKDLDASIKETSHPADVEFFGIPANGKRFVFVVDSSTSMQGIRWEVAVRELLDAINQLTSDHEFYVICFDLKAHFIFNQHPKRTTYLKNDEATMERVKKWIRQHRLGPETLPAGALETALAMKPDAVFLLSDGEIRDQSVQLLRQINRQATEEGSFAVVPVHTVLLMSHLGRLQLQVIARENRGDFREITPQMVGQF